VHWGLLLVIAAYMVVRMSHAAASREQSEVLVQLHRSIGVTVFAVTLFRVAWRWNSRIPPLPGELPLFQKIAARATEYALYFLMPCCLPAAPEPLHGIRAPFSDVGTRSALARQDEAP
jgi:cytochrome b561